MTADPGTFPAALAAAAAGAAAGWLHFATLPRVVALLLAGRLAGALLQLERFVVLACVLAICAWGGASPLLAGAAGALAGRALVLRGTR